MSGANHKLKLLLVTETFAPEIGGGERQAALLARGLQRRGHTVTVLTRRSRAESPAEAVEAGVRIVRIPPVGPGRRVRWGLALRMMPALHRLRSDYDIVLVSGYRALGLPVLVAGRYLNRPVVFKADSLGELSGEYFRAGLAEWRLTPESALVRALLALRKRCLRGAAVQVAISDEIRNELLSQGVAPLRIHVIPNGVDTDTFRPATATERSSLRLRLGLPPGPVLVYTGRLVSYKGLPMLLQAWLELSQRRPGTLVFVGEGGRDIHNCEPALRESVARSGLAERVRFTGAVDRVEEWLRAADLFIFPTENEAFGLSLVEAMACGLAAVTTRAGGLSDYVSDGQNACVIEPGDVRGLTAAIEALLGDPAQATRLGQAARETACRRFGIDAVAARYEDLLCGLCVTAGEAAR
jgi:glycosyltransferase involved in cell wall biosynthesis